MNEQTDDIVDKLKAIKRQSVIQTVLIFILCCMLGYVITLQIVQINWERAKQLEYETFSWNMKQLMKEGEYERVVESCKLRLEDYPKDATAYWNLGTAHYYLENWTESIDAFTKGIELHPAWEEGAKPFMEKAKEHAASQPKITIEGGE